MPAPPKLKRRCFQISLRTLLLLMTVVCAVFGWVGLKVHEGKQRQRAARKILEDEGQIGYDYQRVDGKWNPTLPPPGPEILRRFLGDDFFANVVFVSMEARSDDDLAILAVLPELDDLTVINFDANVTGSGLVHLRNARQLRRLDMSVTKMTDEGMSHIESMTRLKVLNLSNTRISDEGLRHLKSLSQLEKLNLQATTITDAGLVHLHGLGALRELDLDRTRVTDQGIRDLQRVLTKAEIYPWRIQSGRESFLNSTPDPDL